MKKEKNFKEHAVTSTVLQLSGLLPILASWFFKGTVFEWILITVGLAVFAWGLVYRMLYVRCPHCGSKLLGARSLPTFCPDCGEKLL